MLVTGLVVFLWLLSTLAGIGKASRSGDSTSASNVYLPLVAKQPTPTPVRTLIPPDDAANEQSIANLLNQQRNSNGLASVVLADELTQAARMHSRDMADHNFTSHTGSDGSNGGQRMQQAGYNWVTWGEIIGWGFGGDTGSMVNWWMNSPPHRAIILSTAFADFGVGYARNPNSDWGHYWTVNFGKRAAPEIRVSEKMYTCTFSSQGERGGSSLVIHSSEPCQY